MVFVLELIIYAFIACLVIRGVFSWIEPYPKNRVHRFTWDVTEPVLAPVRRLVPPVGGFDVAFLLVIVAAYLILSLVQRSF
jgi:YggT family protein